MQRKPYNSSFPISLNRKLLKLDYTQKYEIAFVDTVVGRVYGVNQIYTRNEFMEDDNSIQNWNALRHPEVKC